MLSLSELPCQEGNQAGKFEEATPWYSFVSIAPLLIGKATEQ
jgi:hypothetical protein